MTSDCNHLPAGAIICGQKRKYTITRVLGQGGFGITYHAMGDVIVDGIETKAEFAIKEFFKSDHCYREDDSFTMGFSRNSTEIVTDTMNDFETEARRLFKLPSHAGIVKVSEVFSANNTRYYAMQYLGNESLDKMDVPMREEEALDLIGKIGEALQFLHDNNITHLDIKPQNIIMHDRQPVLIDFGLSRHYDSHGQATKSSFNGGGYSEGYSPIEQYAGISRFSPECDVYSLGATLLYLLTGSRPIGAIDISPEWINENLPSSTSASVRAALCHALEQRARDRTRSVNEFIRELNTLPAASNKTKEETAMVNTVRIEPPELLSVIDDGGTAATAYVNRPDVEMSAKFSRRKVMWIAFSVSVALIVGLWLMSRENVDNASDDRGEILIDSVNSVSADTMQTQPVTTPIKEEPARQPTVIPAKKKDDSNLTGGEKPATQVVPTKVNDNQAAAAEAFPEPASSIEPVDNPGNKPEKKPEKKAAPPTIDPMSGKYF